eukprot:scaffold7.g3604.t1
MEGSPRPAGAAAGGGSREGTPGGAANGAASGGGAEGGEVGSPPASKLSDEEVKAEEELLAKGREIGGVRALLARAFTRPAEEPARPLLHHDYLLQEARWLAVDVTQERLWKRATALAFAVQIASLRGAWGLRPPPRDAQRYSDELSELRAAAAKEAAAREGGGGRDGAPAGARGARGGRAAAAKEAAAKEAAAEGGGGGGAPPPWLQLEPGEDPAFADLEALGGPGTPPLSELAGGLAYHHDADFASFVGERLLAADMERLLAEEITYRRARKLSSIFGTAEANRRAAALEGGLITDGLAGLIGGDTLAGLLGDEEGKKAKPSKKRQRGYLDDIAGGLEESEAPKRPLPTKEYVHDTYINRKKQRRERVYRDVDTDYDQEQQRKLKAAQAGRAESYGAAAAGAVGRLGRGAAPGMVLWAKQEDDLLLAICHEFGINWTLVSEVLSLSLSMQGIYRPPHLCKQRFRQLTAQEGIEYSEDRALSSLNQQMGKSQARELLVASLPVRDDVLMRLTEALVQVGAAAKQRRVMDDKRNEQVRTRRQEPHTSHLTTGGRRLSPLELMEHANAVHLNQTRQQQMQMQQAAAAQMQAQQQAAAQMQAQQQAAAAAAAPAAAAPPGVTPGQQAAAATQQQQQQAAAAAASAQALQAQQQAAAAAAAAAGAPGMAPGMAGGGGLPLGAPAVGAAVGGPPGGGAPPGAPPKPTPQITLQQLNHILNSNKLPNGQMLTPDMRKAIQEKRDSYLAQMQSQLARQQQMAQMAAQQQAAAAAAAAAGPTATQAALAAAQQAAAVQAGVGVGVRPPLQVYMPPGPGLPGLPGSGAGGAPQLGLPPGAVLPGQVVLPPGGMQPGMQQQQFLQAQQLALQQQAAAAAAQQPPG